VSVCDKALAAVTELQEKLAAAYHELEAAIAQRAETSRDAINRWRNETRQLLDQLSRLTPNAV